MWENQVVDSSPQGTDHQTEQPWGRTRLDEEPSEQPPSRQLSIIDLGLESVGMRIQLTGRILNFIGWPAYDVLNKVCRNFYEWEFFYPDLVVKVALRLTRSSTRSRGSSPFMSAFGVQRPSS